MTSDFDEQEYFENHQRLLEGDKARIALLRREQKRLTSRRKLLNGLGAFGLVGLFSGIYLLTAPSENTAVIFEGSRELYCDVGDDGSTNVVLFMPTDDGFNTYLQVEPVYSRTDLSFSRYIPLNLSTQSLENCVDQHNKTVASAYMTHKAL